MSQRPMSQRLTSCDTCDGFLPSRGAACPHCGAAALQSARPGIMSGLQRKLLTVAGGGLIATTLMACYGATYGPNVREPAMCGQTANDSDGDCVDASVDCDDADATVGECQPQ